MSLPTGFGEQSGCGLTLFPTLSFSFFPSLLYGVGFSGPQNVGSAEDLKYDEKIG